MKRTTCSFAGVFAAATVYFAAAQPVGAISYTVEGWGAQSFPGPNPAPATAQWGANGYPGDTVALQTYTGDVALTPGSQTLKINTLLWDINYTYAGDGDSITPDDPWSELNFAFTALRGMTIGGVAGSISQNGKLDVLWDNDYLSLLDGATITFQLPGYQIDVTPLGLAPEGGSNFDGFPGGTPWSQPNRDVLARFDVTAVPDGGNTLMLLGVATLGCVAVSRCRAGLRRP